MGKEYNPDGNSSDTNTEMYYSIYYIQLYTVYSIVYKIHAISDVTRERERSPVTIISGAGKYIECVLHTQHQEFF